MYRVVLPTEVMLMVFTHMGHLSRLRCKKVSKAFYILASDPSLCTTLPPWMVNADGQGYLDIQ
ncbi:hypothetical protein SARC_17065, partial [Sphaeroforma arctica JP610]